MQDATTPMFHSALPITRRTHRRAESPDTSPVKKTGEERNAFIWTGVARELAYRRNIYDGLGDLAKIADVSQQMYGALMVQEDFRNDTLEPQLSVDDIKTRLRTLIALEEKPEPKA